MRFALFGAETRKFGRAAQDASRSGDSCKPASTRTRRQAVLRVCPCKSCPSASSAGSHAFIGARTLTPRPRKVWRTSTQPKTLRGVACSRHCTNDSEPPRILKRGACAIDPPLPSPCQLDIGLSLRKLCARMFKHRGARTLAVCFVHRSPLHKRLSSSCKAECGLQNAVSPALFGAVTSMHVAFLCLPRRGALTRTGTHTNVQTQRAYSILHQTRQATPTFEAILVLFMFAASAVCGAAQRARAWAANKTGYLPTVVLRR